MKQWSKINIIKDSQRVELDSNKGFVKIIFG